MPVVDTLLKCLKQYINRTEKSDFRTDVLMNLPYSMGQSTLLQGFFEFF